MRVLCEVLAHVQACNISVQLCNGASCTGVSVEAGQCTLTLGCGGRRTLTLPPGTRLVAGSATNLTRDGGFVSLRARLDQRTSLLGSLSADIVNEFRVGEARRPSLTEAVAGAGVGVACGRCRGWAVRRGGYRRVLPLPSVDWEHASQDWFCHLHGQDKDRLKPSALAPATDECYYSELYFIVNRTSVEESVRQEQDGQLTCSGCGTALGVVCGSGAKFWMHSVLWLDADSQILHASSACNILQSLIRNLDKDSFGVNCRLALRAVCGGRTRFLYLVTMNTHQKLLVPDSFSDFAGTTELRPTHRTPDQTTPTETTPDNPKLTDNQSKKLCSDDPGPNTRLKKITATKLLYCTREGEDDVTGAWVDDVNIHILPCSTTFLEEVEEALVSSTLFLPPGLRQVEEMRVGFVIRG